MPPDADIMNEVKRLHGELEALRAQRLQSVDFDRRALMKLVTIVEEEGGERTRLLDREREDREREVSQLRSEVSELREALEKATTALEEVRAEKKGDSSEIAILKQEIAELRCVVNNQAAMHLQSPSDELVNSVREEIEEFKWDCKEALISCKGEVSMLRQEVSGVVATTNGHAEQLRHLEDGFINLASLIPTVRRELDGAGAGGSLHGMGGFAQSSAPSGDGCGGRSSLAPMGASSFEAVFAEAVEAVEALSSGTSCSHIKDAGRAHANSADGAVGRAGGVGAPGSGDGQVWRFAAAGDFAAGDLAAGCRDGCANLDVAFADAMEALGGKGDFDTPSHNRPEDRRGSRRGTGRRTLASSDQELPAIAEAQCEDGSVDGSPAPSPVGAGTCDVLGNPEP